jgi:hypothetical protein
MTSIGFYLIFTKVILLSVKPFKFIQFPQNVFLFVTQPVLCSGAKQLKHLRWLNMLVGCTQ